MDLLKSIIYISGSEEKAFGTAFAFFQDENWTYILTCDHVVSSVGGIDALRVNHRIPATLVAGNDEKGLDLAILQVKAQGAFPIFPIEIANPVGRRSFETAGFYQYDQKILPVGQIVKGKLGEEIRRVSSKYGDSFGWKLEVEGKGEIVSGYSGAPVFDHQMDKVIGVVTHARGKGEEGASISIEALWNINPVLMSQWFGISPTEKPEACQTLEGIPQLLDIIMQLRADIDEAERQLDHDGQISTKVITLVNIVRASLPNMVKCAETTVNETSLVMSETISRMRYELNQIRDIITKRSDCERLKTCLTALDALVNDFQGMVHNMSSRPILDADLIPVSSVRAYAGE